MNEFKAALSKPYKGVDDFVNNVIAPIFGEEFKRSEDLDNILRYPDEIGDFDYIARFGKELQKEANQAGIVRMLNLGCISLKRDPRPIHVYDLTVNGRCRLSRNRVSIQKSVRKVIGKQSAAFMIFHYDTADVGYNDSWEWRFSYCQVSNSNSDSTSERQLSYCQVSDSKKDSTSEKRFTYLLGKNQSCRTASDRFRKLAGKIKEGGVKLEDVTEAFSVEALSDEFFDKYKKHYDNFVEYVTGKRYIKESGKWIEKKIHEPHETLYNAFGKDDKRIRDYVKKMMGRIVFLHFLQKKGWLGVKPNADWGSGDADFMKNLFDKSSSDEKENFLEAVLEPLFFDGLNTDRSENDDMYTPLNVRIPYLNGGLFEKDALDGITVQFPPKFFADLLEFFSEYNFTIDENDPGDAQIGIDPEMLGRIFENLLEDNKDKGAFYTPKEIVQFMCKESLIAFLQSKMEKEELRAPIRDLVENYNTDKLPDECFPALQHLLSDVKICDPAIGSGAFPMGMLREIFFCRTAPSPSEDSVSAAKIKKEIIQNNIYGVDIEKGAVDIARLRFWLALVVDEDSPESLPNLDFKVMQGDSLTESYMGWDLSILGHRCSSQVNPHDQSSFDFVRDSIQSEFVFDETDAQGRVQGLIHAYFNTDSHIQKQRIQTEISSIIREYIRFSGASNEVIDSLSNLQIPNDQFFLWHTFFSDILTRRKNPGFDIVISNPPYIQLSKDNGKLARKYSGLGYETFDRMGDIYCLFYELATRLVRCGGFVCYITSNKWLRTSYGAKLRNFLSTRTNPLLLVDCGGWKIFENATVDTNILIYSIRDNEGRTLCANIPSGISDLSTCVQQRHTICNFSTSDIWMILSPIEQSIKRKIETVGIPLKGWNINIHIGVITGCNDAFIISTEKREEILVNCRSEEERAKTAKLIRPILRGRNIKRYGYEWAGLWLIATFPSRHYDIDEYPAVKNYLLSFGTERLEQTGCTHIIGGEEIKARKKTHNKWFETSDIISYWNGFSRPKLIYGQFKGKFALDLEGYYLGSNEYFITSDTVNLYYILGALNSQIYKFYSNVTMSKLGSATPIAQRDHFINFPLLRPPSTVETEIETRVKLIIELVAAGKIKEMEVVSDEINKLLYQAYGLSREEIMTIERL